MTPTLYFSDDVFLEHPVAVLQDCLSCVVTQELNGVYELEFQYPETGEHFGYLINFGGIIGAAITHKIENYGLEIEAFDIDRYSASIDGIVTFHASHISYRLKNYITSGGGAFTSFEDAFAAIEDNKVVTGDTMFWFNDYTYGLSELDFSAYGYLNAREYMLGADDANSALPQGSLASVWPVDFYFSGTDVTASLRDKGYVTGYQIRFGKNMAGATRERDTGSIASVVLPFWYNEGTQQLVKGGIVRSPKLGPAGASGWNVHDDDQYVRMTTERGEPYYFRPADVRAVPLNLTDKFETAPTKAKLEQEAARWMSKNSTWRAYDNITVDLIDLYDSPEYADIKMLEHCRLGQFVSVYYPELGIAVDRVKIVAVKFDVLAEHYTEVQLNTIKSSLTDVIISNIRGTYA